MTRDIDEPDQLTTKSQERVLIRRLVENHHLSVAERSLLSAGAAHLSSIVEVIRQIVAESGSFPATSGEEFVQNGVVIKPNARGYLVEVHAEMGILRHELVSTEQFATVELAAISAISILWGDNIDGVPIVNDLVPTRTLSLDQG